MRPEVVWKRTRGGRAWHIFKDGADTPVCGVVSEVWIREGRISRGRLPVHRQCWQLCPWEPRLNPVMTEREIKREALNG
jgi:hypothetical protein